VGAVYKRMISEFYQSGGTWLSSALHGHFVDLYGAFKLAIRNLTALDKEKKCLRIIRKGMVPVMSKWRQSTIDWCWTENTNPKSGGSRM
jgi:hypothetical protein